MPKTMITPATPDDLTVLHGLIRELARFEKLEHEFTATPEALGQALFGAHRVAEALLVHVDGVAAGYAIYYHTFSSFTGRPGIWLDDLYIVPHYRKQGLGRQLIEAVARLAAERNCGRFEWIALDWNKRALDFYRSLGAKTLDDWVLLRINPTDMLPKDSATP
jgi:GNAT superfamily N-acetyltransferase